LFTSVLIWRVVWLRLGQWVLHHKYVYGRLLINNQLQSSIRERVQKL
jgi:hypothetical protein